LNLTIIQQKIAGCIQLCNSTYEVFNPALIVEASTEDVLMGNGAEAADWNWSDGGDDTEYGDDSGENGLNLVALAGPPADARGNDAKQPTARKPEDEPLEEPSLTRPLSTIISERLSKLAADDHQGREALGLKVAKLADERAAKFHPEVAMKAVVDRLNAGGLPVEANMQLHKVFADTAQNMMLPIEARLLIAQAQLQAGKDPTKVLTEAAQIADKLPIELFKKEFQHVLKDLKTCPPELQAALNAFAERIQSSSPDKGITNTAVNLRKQLAAVNLGLQAPTEESRLANLHPDKALEFARQAQEASKKLGLNPNNDQTLQNIMSIASVLGAADYISKNFQTFAGKDNYISSAELSSAAIPAKDRELHADGLKAIAAQFNKIIALSNDEKLYESQISDKDIKSFLAQKIAP
jgi:hypothetical protein